MIEPGSSRQSCDPKRVNRCYPATDRECCHAVYPPHRNLSAKVRVFIDALVEYVRTGTDMA